jgi:adenylate cyclase
VLNGYFQRMSDAIHEHRGHVAHFLGDGIVAYFGALQPNPWQSSDGVRAALAMRAAIREYNVELGREGLPLLALGSASTAVWGWSAWWARASGWSTTLSDAP